jgi:hypothetical protein
MLAGAVAALVALAAAGALFFRLGAGGPKEQRHRTLKLASGRTVEIMALYLAFGDEHSQRGAIDDGVGVEYVTSSAEEGARDREAEEVFEAIRPLTESLGVPSMSVSAFPSPWRKGRYERHDYTRDASGGWTSQRTEAKVFANE